MLNLNFTPFPVLTTQRLVLKQLDDSLLEAFYSLRSNQEIMQKLDKEPAKNIEEIRALLDLITADIQNNRGITWAIVFKETNGYIGNLSFHKIYPDHHRAEIGYAILPQFQRQGIVSEAIDEVMKYGFDVAGFHTIEAKINPENIASRSLLEKKGFVKEAHFKESFYFRGEFSDTAVYSLIKPNN